MPLRKVVKKSTAPPDTSVSKTGEYSNTFGRPEAYKPIQVVAPLVPSPFAVAGLPASSTRDLNYFFNLAGSLYRESVGQGQASTSTGADAPPSYGDDFQDTQMDVAAVMVIWLFRLTATHVFPVTERFHLGPADRQPLYSLTAQPSIRSAQEFNELSIQRRDPIKGVWYPVCTSDIEPSLDLVKPGNWAVSRLNMTSLPVWHKILSNQVVQKIAHHGQGNSLRLSWGDRETLGRLGDAYGLWWESGGEHGVAECFFVVEGWKGFDEGSRRGCIKIKAPESDENGQYKDPHGTVDNLAVAYFHGDGKTPPQFVCHDAQAQVRMDILMSGLMTVMVIETRKAAVIKELGSLPGYGTGAHFSSRLVEEGRDIIGDSFNEHRFG
ncbi:hypothetical protein V8E51_019996 [Hyaloscypha variabilis]